MLYSNSDVSFAPAVSGGGYNVTQINTIHATIPPNADAETYGNAIAKALQPYGGMVNIRLVHQMREVQGVGA